MKQKWISTSNSQDFKMKNRTNTDVRPDIEEEEARRDVAVHLLAAIVVLVILTSLLLSCLLARHRIKQVRLTLLQR